MDRNDELKASNKLINALGDVIRKVDITTMPRCKFCQSDNVVFN